MSLGSKLTLWLLVPLLAVLIALAAITLRRERDAHYRQAADEAERIVNTLSIPMADALRRNAPGGRVRDRPAIHPGGGPIRGGGL